MVGVALFEWYVIVHWRGGQMWHFISSLMLPFNGDYVIAQSRQSNF